MRVRTPACSPKSLGQSNVRSGPRLYGRANVTVADVQRISNETAGTRPIRTAATCPLGAGTRPLRPSPLATSRVRPDSHTEPRRNWNGCVTSRAALDYVPATRRLRRSRSGRDDRSFRRRFLEEELDPVAWGHLDEACRDLLEVVGRRLGRIERGLERLLEELLDARWSKGEDHPHRARAFVPEAVQPATWDVHEIARAGR